MQILYKKTLEGMDTSMIFEKTVMDHVENLLEQKVSQEFKRLMPSRTNVTDYDQVGPLGFHLCRNRSLRRLCRPGLGDGPGDSPDGWASEGI